MHMYMVLFNLKAIKIIFYISEIIFFMYNRIRVVFRGK